MGWGEEGEGRGGEVDVLERHGGGEGWIGEGILLLLAGLVGDEVVCLKSYVSISYTGMLTGPVGFRQ